MRRDSQYQFLDAGAGRKLERFGPWVLARPCAQAVWRPQFPALWNEADALFSREQGAHWQFREPRLREGWHCTLGGLEFFLKPTDFGHVGVFPEHLLGWRMVQGALRRFPGPDAPSVLNLFAYSGGATLACAQAGAQVCHLDASRKMTDWARDNARINRLEQAPIRWIVDDVTKFLKRELRRGRRYDGIILDPPSFGRGTSQELFQIDACMLELLELCREILSPRPLFLLLTCHTPGYTPLVLSHLATQTLPPGEIRSGEMALPVEDPGVMAVPSGAYAFWQPDAPRQ
ncbi:MAG: class I SAM-dependent methyltransferase [Oligosphaeraceae bacterium]